MANCFSTVVGWSHLTHHSWSQTALSRPQPGTQGKRFMLGGRDGQYANVERCAFKLSLEITRAGRCLSNSIRHTSPRRGYQRTGLVPLRQAVTGVTRTYVPPSERHVALADHQPGAR